jgi:hypothetical protein
VLRPVPVRHEERRANGSLWVLGFHDADGRQCGIWRRFHARGPLERPSVEVICSYEEGVLHGQWSETFPNGHMGSIGHYERGARHGTWRLWYDSGQLREHGTFQWGLCVGVHTQYDRMGTRVLKQHMAHGELHGRQRRWNGDGMCIEDSMMWYGRRHGHHRAWRRAADHGNDGTAADRPRSPVAVLTLDSRYVDGLLHGECREHHVLSEDTLSGLYAHTRVSWFTHGRRWGSVIEYFDTDEVFSMHFIDDKQVSPEEFAYATTAAHILQRWWRWAWMYRYRRMLMGVLCVPRGHTSTLGALFPLGGEDARASYARSHASVSAHARPCNYDGSSKAPCRSSKTPTISSTPAAAETRRRT